MRVVALAAHEAGGPLRPLVRELGPPGPDEVDVRVTHCGICHTDVGVIDDEWGVARFPVVAGHEAVGVVVAVGANARLAVGTRVGVGAIAGSCGHCAQCLGGRHNLCAARDDVVLRGDGGAFADHLRASDWRHVHPLPDALPSAEAAPLLCAGTTVFGPLLANGVRPTDRVAVVGVGGLGHLALQFLAGWGCAVTAVSTTRAKEAEARAFGATDFRTPGELVEGSFDFVLSTVPADLPWDDYLAALRPGGTLCVVGLPAGAISVRPMSLLPQAKRIVGGIPATPSENRLMLDFAARHGIRAAVEVFPVGEVERALELVRGGGARYRAVLEF
ncbi:MULTISPECIES: NAD(P)-dependent alcohol dehydrogenase [Actinosynnema]|uniref:alcohol dehydrogenase (NADP(+)) n=1 Tax=Actinosynnema pretiosum TaxID=42197 RepID=A0A290Z6Y6_9PSEU|nr:NAD(P)-dependent alcohol dehydrogenase [Actinosynnema pretiosum]ATE54745.1 alcohol dehydrogenase [Actinosynnema pretiosum]